MKICCSRIGIIASALMVAAANAAATEKVAQNEKNVDAASSVTEDDRRSRELFVNHYTKDADLNFQRSYLAITKAEDYKYLLRNTQLMGEVPTSPGWPDAATDTTPRKLPRISKNRVVGLTLSQSGGIYDPVSVQIKNVPSGVSNSTNAEAGVKLGLTATTGGAGLTGQQYAGGAQPKVVPDRDPGFYFDGQCVTSGGRGRHNQEKHSCLYNLCLGGGGANCLALYCGTTHTFNQMKMPGNTYKNSPPLPPSYPCVIIGGTNTFQGAKGNVDITTLTGLTSPKAGKTQVGYVTQRLNVVSNKALPAGP